MFSRSSPSFPWLLAAAIWVGALATLCIGLMYTGPLQAGLQRVVPPLRRTPLPTPTLVWPTPSPTNTPRPTPTSVPTPTPSLSLRGGEIDTIAAAVAYEASSESERGQRAVAYVILHRCELTGKFPREVLTKEFFGSEVGPDHLGRMEDWWKPDGTPITLEIWAQITEVAEGVANRWSWDEFPTSTHFYSKCVLKEPPTWVKGLEPLGCIGCHCFYGESIHRGSNSLSLSTHTFTGDNGVLLKSHNDAWTTFRGIVDIQDNEANTLVLAGPVPNAAGSVIETGISDGVISIDARTTGAGGHSAVALVFRYQDTTHYWSWGINPAAGTAHLGYWNPEWTQVSMIDSGFQYGYTYNLMARLQRDRIDVYVDGVWHSGINNSLFQGETEHGFLGETLTGLRFDNFKAWEENNSLDSSIGRAVGL